MPTSPKRRDYSRRPKATFLLFPAVILDPTVLDELGVIPGTRPDEDPPKVVLSRTDWEKVLADPARAKRAIRFLGRTKEDNPLKGGLPVPEEPTPAAAAAKVARPKSPRKPGPFAHLRNLPLDQALARAQADHEARLSAGVDPEASLATLLKALETVRKWETERVIPAPLPVPEGEEPPTPTELRRMAAGG